MRDILLKHRDNYIECEIDGLKLTYTYSFDPRVHYVRSLRDDTAYEKLKRKINDAFHSYEDGDDGWEMTAELLETPEFDRFFSNDIPQMHFDMRSRDEIADYENEAFDKVWLMRNCCISEREPVHEVSRSGMERIMSTYNDIPKNGYDTWECGYWNGIMGALRWVLGDEKDFLDT